jgi:two-component system sensor histidine kinase KdpD
MRWSRLVTTGSGYPFALAAVALVTAALMPLRALLTPDQIVLFYIPVIVVVARLAGVGPSALSACVAFVALVYFFIPPLFVIAVSSGRDWLTLAVFMLVALVAGQQTGRMRQREQLAVARQRDLALLNRLSSRLVSEESTERMASFIASEVVAVLGASRCVVFLAHAGRAERFAAAGAAGGGVAEEALADWVAANDKAVGLPEVPDLPADERPVSVAATAAIDGVASDGVYLPLQSTDTVEGVLYARPLAGAGGFGADELRLLVAVANLASAYLERQRLGKDAAQTAALHESDRLKSTLVSSVSHELKTPLAAVTARVTGLLEEGSAVQPQRVHAELLEVEADLGRLNTSIGDLLDLSRLESDAWRPKMDRYDLSEILGTVMSRVPAAEHDRVEFEVPEDLPPIRVDFAQWARVLHNLLENALAYSAPGSRVRVCAKVLGDSVVTWIEDMGPGVPDDEKQHVFDKFYRGSASASVPSGTGLGLAIAREIVRSHGGRLWVEDVEPQGARFAVAVPVSFEEGPNAQ